MCLNSMSPRRTRQLAPAAVLRVYASWCCENAVGLVRICSTLQALQQPGAAAVACKQWHALLLLLEVHGLALLCR
jgi:hypothetical protein